MEIIYRAKDGKEFDDEYDCEEYERSITPHTFKMWDENCNPITYYDVNGYGSATYVGVRNQEEVEDVSNEFRYFGYSCEGIDDIGLYYYTDGRIVPQWENALNIIELCSKRIDNIKEMMKSLNIEGQ